MRTSEYRELVEGGRRRVRQHDYPLPQPFLFLPDDPQLRQNVIRERRGQIAKLVGIGRIATDSMVSDTTTYSRLLAARYGLEFKESERPHTLVYLSRQALELALCGGDSSGNIRPALLQRGQPKSAHAILRRAASFDEFASRSAVEVSARVHGLTTTPWVSSYTDNVGLLLNVSLVRSAKDGSIMAEALDMERDYLQTVYGYGNSRKHGRLHIGIGRVSVPRAYADQLLPQFIEEFTTTPLAPYIALSEVQVVPLERLPNDSSPNNW